jgi:hypothetical protein
MNSSPQRGCTYAEHVPQLVRHGGQDDRVLARIRLGLVISTHERA